MLCQLSYSRGAPGARRDGARGLREGHEGWTDGGPERRGGAGTAAGRFRRGEGGGFREGRERSEGAVGAKAAGERAGGGAGRIRTSEGRCRQVYSLLRLAASLPLRAPPRRLTGAPRRTEAGGSSGMRNGEPSVGMTIRGRVPGADRPVARPGSAGPGTPSRPGARQRPRECAEATTPETGPEPGAGEGT